MYRGFNPDVIVFLIALIHPSALTKMSTRNLPGGKGRPARNADNLTAICVPIG
jgi:hypothetical protein